MVDEQAFVVFRITGEHYDEYLGVAANIQTAKRMCLADQKQKLTGWEHMAQWRAANGRTSETELTPVIDLVWFEDSDGDIRTTEDSTFVHSYDRGYCIIASTVQK